jgi:hypothetical protein
MTCRWRRPENLRKFPDLGQPYTALVISVGPDLEIAVNNSTRSCLRASSMISRLMSATRHPKAVRNPFHTGIQHGCTESSLGHCNCWRWILAVRVLAVHFLGLVLTRLQDVGGHD